MAYVGPYLCKDGPLFAETDALGRFATTADGRTHLVDFGAFDCGAFDCGVADFTSKGRRALV